MNWSNWKQMIGSNYFGKKSFVFSDERGGILSFSFCLVGWGQILICDGWESSDMQGGWFEWDGGCCDGWGQENTLTRPCPSKFWELTHMEHKSFQTLSQALEEISGGVLLFLSDNYKWKEDGERDAAGCSGWLLWSCNWVIWCSRCLLQECSVKWSLFLAPYLLLCWLGLGIE